MLDGFFLIVCRFSVCGSVGIGCCSVGGMRHFVEIVLNAFQRFIILFRVEMHAVFRFGYLFVFDLFIDKAAQQGIDYEGDRSADQQSDQSEEGAEQDDGRDHDDRRQTDA